MWTKTQSRLAPPSACPYLGGVTYNETITDLIEDFAFLTDWEDRYMHVIDMGKALAGLPDALKTDATRVKGCVSQVWVMTREEDGKLYFDGDSDAHIVRGLVAIVLAIYSGQTPKQIDALDAEPILSELGLAEHLSPQRSNGLRAMVGRIKAEAQQRL